MPDESRPKFSVRGFEPGDEQAILQLFQKCFGVERDVDHWRWKFEKNPYGNRRISVALDAQKHLIGHFSGYLASFRDQGRSVLGLQMGDSMTDPSARNLGRGPTSVFGRTMAHFVDTFLTQDVAFGYGFNVGNVQKFFRRFLGADFIEDVPYRVLDVQKVDLRSSRIGRRLRGFTFELVDRITPEWTRLFERVAVDYTFLARRDEQYVAWRYLQRPDVPYLIVTLRHWGRLAGWVVVLPQGERMLLGDLLFEPSKISLLRPLLGHLASIYGVSQIAGWFPARPAWLDVALRDAGFQMVPEPQNLALIARAFRMPDALERIRSSLFYTMGDGDLF